MLSIRNLCKLNRLNKIRHPGRLKGLELKRSAGNEPQYKPIYKFKFIETFGSLQRLKIYQTGLTVGGVTLSQLLCSTGLISNDVVKSTAALGFTGCLVLYTFGYLANGIIGLIYVNENDKTVKFSYLDFWGRRKNEVTQMDDIIAISDMETSYIDPLYNKVTTYSNPQKFLKLSIKSGEIKDPELFQKIFRV